MRVKGSTKALAVTTDCNSAYVYADPYRGTMIAVAEAARNIVCSGGLPVAITNCLNFGNPYNPEVYFQFVNAIKGMGEACRKFDTPVTGGNVSFYNQSVYKNGTEPVYPTPTIGMLGLLDHYEQAMTLYFKEAGQSIYLLGQSRDDLGSSEYLRLIHGVAHSPVPYFELEEEYALQQEIAKIIKAGLIDACHDVSEGGLFVTLMEAAMPKGFGFEINTDSDIRKDAFLFGESQSRVMVAVKPEQEEALLNHLNAQNIIYTKLGHTVVGNVSIDGQDYGAVREWKSTYDHTLGELIEQ